MNHSFYIDIGELLCEKNYNHTTYISYLTFLFFLQNFINYSTIKRTHIRLIRKSNMDESHIDEIECSDKYVRRPNQYDIHEYHIMEDFAYITWNQKHKEKLLRVFTWKETRY